MSKAAAAGFVLALAMATGVYLLKDRVQRSEGELRSLRGSIQSELGRLDRLHTEWAVINQPTRLAGLARSHLELEPLDPTRLVAIDDLPYRDELALAGQTWPVRLLYRQVTDRRHPRLSPGDPLERRGAIWDDGGSDHPSPQSARQRSTSSGCRARAQPSASRSSFPISA